MFSIKVTITNPNLSPTFPNVAVDFIPTYLRCAKEVGVSQALEEFEIAVRQLF